MPLPAVAYVAGAAGSQLAFRAAASPMGQQAIRIAHNSAVGVATGIGAGFNYASQAAGNAYNWLMGHGEPPAAVQALQEQAAPVHAQQTAQYDNSPP